jgi:hypothetical protein
MTMKAPVRISLFLLLALVTILLAACNVSVQTGPAATVDVEGTANAIKQQVATSVASTKVALEATVMAAATEAPIPTTPAPAEEATEATTPEPPTPIVKTRIPKVTVMVPTVDARITVQVPTPPAIITPVITIPANVTPVVTLPPPMRVCTPPAATSFQQILNTHPSLSAALGCPTGIDPHVTPDAWEVQTAFQPFEHGMMIWSNKIGYYDRPVVYVLSENGSYQRYDDTFQDGVDPESGGEIPPAGLFEPIRGFGKVWRENPGVRSALGWATAPEIGGPGRFQIMENGAMIWLSETGYTYVFHRDTRQWYEFNVPFQP